MKLGRFIIGTHRHAQRHAVRSRTTATSSTTDAPGQDEDGRLRRRGGNAVRLFDIDIPDSRMFQRDLDV